jgi:NAD(P)-dependent dehydrogenase (short-subunit alcohol dehydrogenase family)
MARSAEHLAETVESIESEGGSAIALQADVTDADRVDQALRSLRTEIGSAMVLINNAAVVDPLGRTPKLDRALASRHLEVNVTAPIMLASAVLAPMSLAGWGRIANISSSIAAHPEMMVGMTTYAARRRRSKATP